MSIKEIARTIADFRLEFRGAIGQLVRADVYKAEQGATARRIEILEKDRDQAETDRKATHRVAIGALLTCIGTVIASLLLVSLR